MKSHTLIMTICMLITMNFYAQDFHFSAIEYSPHSINPALAGANHGLKASVNYRNQWNAVGTPFKTMGANFDMRVNSRNYMRNGNLAFGIDFFNDQAGVEAIKTNKVGVTSAYHIKIDDQNYFGLGLQGAFGNRSMGEIDGMWGNQFDGNNYNPSIESGEEFSNASFSYFDISAGVVYTYKSGKKRRAETNKTLVNIGFAAYHLNRPGYSFINKKEEQLYMRFSAFFRGAFKLGETDLYLEPEVITHFQGPHFDTHLGTDLRYVFGGGGYNYGSNDQTTSLALGMLFRNSDALISRLSIRFVGVDIGFAYDFNVFNDLQRLSNGKGAFEIYLGYRIENISSRNRIR